MTSVPARSRRPLPVRTPKVEVRDCLYREHRTVALILPRLLMQNCCYFI